MVYVIAIISILLGSLAQIFLKIAVNFSSSLCEQPLLSKIITLINSKMVIGLSLYAISLVLWFYVLGKLPVSKAYPLVSLGYVFVYVFAYLYLNESFSFLRCIGLTIIIAGVVLISKS